MKHQNLVAALFAVAVLILPANAAHLDNPNLLVDAGFEGTITADGPPFVGLWEGFTGGGGATSDFTTLMPRSDQQQLELNIPTPDANNFAGAFQDVPVPAAFAGAQWWYSGWHKSLLGPNGSEIRVEWRDSVNDVEISRTPNLAPMIGSAYEEFILSDTVPAGADTARVVYAIQSFGANPGQQVLVDDVNFNVAGLVPEPTTMCLATFAGLAMFGMRRRS